jgi:uncharacterized membrane protein YbhN (UPF0104 family)
MPSRKQRFWKWLKTVLKCLFAVAVLFFIARQFQRDFVAANRPSLSVRSIAYGWLILGGVLYLLGLGFSLLFWYRLLLSLGQRPEIPAAIRAYYAGHMGKYLPGKAWALMLRATLIRSSAVRLGVAVSTSFYEVLTTMAGGTLLALILALTVLPRSEQSMPAGTLRSLLSGQPMKADYINQTVLVTLASILLAVVGFPLLPPVFNRLVKHLSLPFHAGPSLTERFGWRNLTEGLLWTAFGWLILGASLWAVARAASPQVISFRADLWWRFSVYLAIAYVAGFVIFLVPSGLGIREFFLSVFLAQELALQSDLAAAELRWLAAWIVVLLRIVWTTAEVIIVSIVWWLPSPTTEDQTALVVAAQEPQLDRAAEPG